MGGGGDMHCMFMGHHKPLPCMYGLVAASTSWFMGGGLAVAGRLLLKMGTYRQEE